MLKKKRKNKNLVSVSYTIEKTPVILKMYFFFLIYSHYVFLGIFEKENKMFKSLASLIFFLSFRSFRIHCENLRRTVIQISIHHDRRILIVNLYNAKHYILSRHACVFIFSVNKSVIWHFIKCINPSKKMEISLEHVVLLRRTTRT